MKPINIYFFKHEVTCFVKKKIFALINHQKLDNLTLNYPKIVLLSGEVVPPPPQNILFFADLHELEQVKKG